MRDKKPFGLNVEGALLASLQIHFPTEVVIHSGGGRCGVMEYLLPHAREAKLEVFSDEQVRGWAPVHPPSACATARHGSNVRQE
jgi:hypothetical protein